MVRSITRLPKLSKSLSEEVFSFQSSPWVLSAVTHELYRRVIGPYEDEKIRENGDV